MRLRFLAKTIPICMHNNENRTVCDLLEHSVSSAMGTQKVDFRSLNKIYFTIRNFIIIRPKSYKPLKL